MAHIGDEDFTVRINTDGEEYNIEVCYGKLYPDNHHLFLWVFLFLISCVDTSVAQTRFGGSVCFGMRRERNKKPIWLASVDCY